MPVRMRAATYKMPEADFERLMDIIKTDETQYVYELAFLLFVCLLYPSDASHHPRC